MVFEKTIADKLFRVDINNLAELADISLFVQSGETIIMTTVVALPKENDLDYFPLMVNYEEKFYASGEIKGSRFVRREARPSDNAILTSRLIDRSIRPLFSKNLDKEVQVVNTVLSYDKESSPDILALLGTSIALSISNIPWNGPVIGIRVVKSNNSNDDCNHRPCFIINPTIEEIKKSEMNLLFSITKKDGEFLINMIEAVANQNDEETLLNALDFAQNEIKELFDFQEKIIKEIKGKTTNHKSQITNYKQVTREESDCEELEKFVKEFLEKRMIEIYQKRDKRERVDTLVEIKQDLKNEVEKMHLEKIDPGKVDLLHAQYEKVLAEIIKKNIINGKRTDRRALDEIRALDFKTAILPRTHGSGLFSRGQTRVLSTLTLSGPDDSQIINDMETNEKKRFMHHYNFPNYSTGEIGPFRGPGRREIGHGALVEKALEKIIPSEDEFPYTIRLVSEVLSSNGSTSQASITAASLALMDGGVPIKEAVAGIAIGLFTDDSNRRSYKLVSDIQGMEDHYGEMDFKVGGTKNGITAIQMDVKNYGISKKILAEALNLAKRNRLEILEKMRQEISGPRETLSKHAPIIKRIQIDPERIGEVIGTGGKIINDIIKRFNVKIDIEDSGKVYIIGKDVESVRKAIDWIEGLLREIQVGDILDGKIVKILDFGAFVEIGTKQNGLIHISKLSNQRVQKVEDIVKAGDVVKVKVIAIDDKDRINLQLIRG